ncbi:unnamed protein product [Cyprideis torosa]|uniref:Phosphoacetylglucosamine mutase n=1 Tax=Cyprideis torosa TaxID=163714 RepID=A0A7R8W2V1_9CRUS|nr:unnamed protein product [Cyprideis torosa]CAG0880126.1 unnamed protein product [Cyprideis torosa]
MGIYDEAVRRGEIDHPRDPKLFDSPITYGTAGFRMKATIMDSVMYRMGILACFRSCFTNGTVGVMITASHNPIEDNGVKLIEPNGFRMGSGKQPPPPTCKSGEMLPTDWEKIGTKLTNVSDGKLLMEVLDEIGSAVGYQPGIPSVVIGRDTRPSGPAMLKAVKDGVEAMQGKVRDLGILTTPQMHYLVWHINNSTDPASCVPTTMDYFRPICSAFRSVFPNLKGASRYTADLVVDCAHGVGGQETKLLAKELDGLLCITVANDGSIPNRLNKECGSDFVKTKTIIPVGLEDIPIGTRCCSLDGDADRIVYFYLREDNQFCLLDGDRIACLFAMYIKELLEEAGLDVKLGVIQTAYSNGASTDYVKEVLGLPVSCVKTGVKHLHHEAVMNYDIGVYFEANGHGTITVSDTVRKALEGRTTQAAKKLQGILAFMNHCIGDALTDILLVELILASKDMNHIDWTELYKDRPNRLAKLKVKDRRVVTTTDAERKAVTPEALQPAVDALVAKYPKSRAFVRPSGTEDVVRIYVEAANDGDCETLCQEVTRVTYDICGGGLLLHNVSREGENSVESASSEDLTWEVDLIEVTDEKPAPDNYFLFYFLCGISGMISCSVTHVALVALDGIKCRLQVDPSKYQTVVHSLRIIVSEEGLKGLFRGWVPTMIGYGMQGFVKFGLYEILKGFLIPGGLQDVHVVTLIYFVSSAIAEFFADILLAPMEATKIHMQTDDEINEEERSSSMADVIEKILKAEGPRGLYKGLPALWLRQIPYTMMKFASFERIARPESNTKGSGPRGESPYSADSLLNGSYSEQSTVVPHFSNDKELQIFELQSQLSAKTSKITEIQKENQSLHESSARQSSIISSLKNRIQELEEKNASLAELQCKDEASLSTLRRENRMLIDRITDLESRLRGSISDLGESERQGDATKRRFEEICQRVKSALNLDHSTFYSEGELCSRITDLVHENKDLSYKVSSCKEAVERAEAEARESRETIARLISELEQDQRQSATQLAAIEKIKMERDSINQSKQDLEKRARELQDRLHSITQAWQDSNTSSHFKDLRIQALEEKLRIQGLASTQQEQEYRNFRESLAMLLNASSSEPSVPPTNETIKAKIKDILIRKKEADDNNGAFREQLCELSEKLAKQSRLLEDADMKMKTAEEAVASAEQRTRQASDDLATIDLLRDKLHREQEMYHRLTRRLATAMKIDDVSTDGLNLELNAETLCARADQLAKLEGDKVHDKTVQCHQLQQKLRSLRDQLEKKDLQVDLIKRRMTALEDNSKAYSSLQKEVDHANFKAHKYSRQVEKLQTQLNESTAQISHMKAQVAQVAELKLKLSERERESALLHHRVLDLEREESRHRRKMTALKEAARSKGQWVEEEKRLSDNAIEVLSADLAATKQALSDTSRRERQLLDFRGMIAKIIGMDVASLSVPDYEVIAQLEKLVAAHREYNLVSQKYCNTAASSFISQNHSSESPLNQGSRSQSQSPKKHRSQVHSPNRGSRVRFSTESSDPNLDCTAEQESQGVPDLFKVANDDVSHDDDDSGEAAKKSLNRVTAHEGGESILKLPERDYVIRRSTTQTERRPETSRKVYASSSERNIRIPVPTDTNSDFSDSDIEEFSVDIKSPKKYIRSNPAH